MLRFSNVVALLALGFALAAVRAGATDVPAEALWVALKSGGHIALMRHAEAPGTGDPANFRLDDCSTQRNLSAAGRQQAERIGQAVREQGIMIGRVWSSRWCRCRETAQRLGFAPVEPLPILDSFFRDRERGSQQTAALRRFVSEPRTGPSLILVTHQVNITALTGILPQPGDIVVIRPMGNGRFTVLGIIPG